MPDFVHLHVHSEYSLLDGMCRIKDIPKRAKELGMKAIALTDHGVMFGSAIFYQACQKEGIKAITGCEVYVAPGSRFDKEFSRDEDKYNHLILLVKNKEGYQNLIKLVSIGYTEGFYSKPRIDKEVLEKYSEGLICLSGCLAGEISKFILRDEIENAEKIALWYKEIFGEDYYLEIQNNGLREQVIVNQQLIQISRKLNIPLVATNDAHYLKKEDSFNHEILLCMQTGKRITDSDRMRFETNDFYIKSPKEMADYFDAIPEAIENTVKIADKCNFDFEFGVTKLPNYNVPEDFKTHEDFFRYLAKNGLEERYGKNYSDEIKKRAEYEMNVISKMGYVDYYLIVRDFIHFAKTHDIPVGPGRGSGAGSIIAYAIGITDIDPIKYGLLFERFLNPERISMPDFDVDFSDGKREDVIKYVTEKYGADHVSQIITFGTLAAKNVIRNVGRVLNIPLPKVDKIAKLIPREIHITIEQALQEVKELKNLYEEDEEVHRLIDISKSLEGMPKNASTHACGVVITKNPVDTYVPLYLNEGNTATQYTMTLLEELGLLKMDFLGLRTLTVIEDCIRLVEENREIKVQIDEKMNDQKVFKLWQDGNTYGIFQFESNGMTAFMKELKPDCLEDLIAGVSLYRPGPMDQIPRYIKGKQNPGHNEYTHPRLEPILNVTYGCMVYQEQVMQIVRELAGYSLGRADLVRRAMGKKKLDVMAKEREIFIHGQVDEKGNIIVPGCIRNGIDENSANKIFDEMAEFAKYAFNKSHAACYAVIAYRTAYLKCYYPEEFMAATLNSFLGNLDKIPIYIEECKKLGIQILKPSINESYTKFTVKDGKIRYGMGSIKNVGNSVIDVIVDERKQNGVFSSFTDFCERIANLSVNKKCIESLIKAGCFDEFGKNRHTLISSFEGILDIINSTNKAKIQNQVSVFDLLDANGQGEDNCQYEYQEQKEYDMKEFLSMEKEMLGIYLSGHPLEKYKNKIEKITNINSLEIKEIGIELQETGKLKKHKEDEFIKTAGIISSVKKKITKSNSQMCFLTIDDLFGSIEVIVFESVYNKYSYAIEEDKIVYVEGRLSIREDEPTKIVANKIIELVSEDNSISRITINITNYTENKKQELREAIRYYSKKPNADTVVEVIINDETRNCGKIYTNKNILEKWYARFGENNINIY